MPRTTVTLQADVARSLKNEARRSNRSFKAVLNDAIRRGLNLVSPGPKPRYRVKPHKTQLALGVDPLEFNQLADELEDARARLNG